MLMLAEISELSNGPYVQDPVGVLAVLLAVLAVILAMEAHPVLGKPLKIIPALALCYFVPSFLATFGVIPNKAELYTWIKDYVLPASLLLLTLSLDLQAILRLGPKAIIMMLAGTFGVVIGGPIALLATREMLPQDAWQGMAALAGSWIGGGANFYAIGKSEFVNASDLTLAPIIVVDTFVGAVWMGVLLFLAGRSRAIDSRLGADVSGIERLKKKITDYQAQVLHPAKTWELMVIVALAFGMSWIAGAAVYDPQTTRGFLKPFLEVPIPGSSSFLVSGFTWTVILVTTIGVALSFTPLRRLEGAGASRVGSVMIYLLVASIGAKADLRAIGDTPAFIIMGFIWMFFHVAALVAVAWVIKAPVFFLAVGSQSNIGGAASAPVVAGAFHPSLAPVGALLAVLGYVLGTYAALLCAVMLRLVAVWGG